MLRPSFQLGFLLPLVLIVLGAVEVGLRLLPADTFTYRAWEAVTRDPVPGAPFDPDQAYSTGATYGDLAALGNLPWAREYRTERFTTDALGYRNPPDLAQGEEVDAILLGTSFSVGAGMNGDETLASQIGEHSGLRIYNASGPEYFQQTALWRVRALNERLRLRRRLVIYEYLDRYDPPPMRPLGEQGRLAASMSSTCPIGATYAVSELQCGLFRLVGPSPVSPLRILTDRAYKRLENGHVLPNQAAQYVLPLHLRNGDIMLFLPLDLAAAGRPRSVPSATEYFGWLQQELAQLDLELLVVLLPDKSTVYGPLLADPPASSAQAADFLHGLQTTLEAHSIPAVNLLEPLSVAAAVGLDQGEYVYWRDDTHWDPRGIAVAAEAILARIDQGTTR